MQQELQTERSVDFTYENTHRGETVPVHRVRPAFQPKGRHGDSQGDTYGGKATSVPGVWEELQKEEQLKHTSKDPCRRQNGLHSATVILQILLIYNANTTT